MGITLPSGLSPLTRGNLFLKPASMRGRGPIPAHAGEPQGGMIFALPPWAYPRSRGGTAWLARKTERSLGLSPLTRGNHGQRVEMGQHLGPIPAHAGEPDAASCCPSQAGAYPRSRGGTFLGALAHVKGGGLSPLTRGNRNNIRNIDSSSGPIPAHAGEPTSVCRAAISLRAYPRSRGGT